VLSIVRGRRNSTVRRKRSSAAENTYANSTQLFNSVGYRDENSNLRLGTDSYADLPGIVLDYFWICCVFIGLS
jgi:hypothetical protein